MNLLELHKLNRAVWIALIEDEKFVEANNSFNMYMTNLQKLKLPKNLKEELNTEYKYAQEIYYKKMLDKAEFLYNSEKYSSAIICYQILSNVCNQFYFDKFPVRYYIKTLLRLEQYDLAKILMNKLLEFDNSHDILSFIADCYAQMKEYENAIIYYEKYINIKEKHEVNADEWNLLGCYYERYAKDNNYNEKTINSAVNCFKKAVAQAPHNKLFVKNLAISTPDTDIYLKQQYFAQLLNFGLSYRDQFDYSAFCLKSQNFDEWHKYFDARIKLKENSEHFSVLTKPMWNGLDDISNSTLLLYAEEGFGDNFLMWGYVNRIVNKVKKIIYVAHDTMLPVFINNDMNIEVISLTEFKNSDIHYDYYLPIVSLWTTLKLTKENISVGEGYLKSNKELFNYYKNTFFNNDKLKIGISCFGNKNGNITRDVPMSYFNKIANLENIQLYMLNKNTTIDELKKYFDKRVINVANVFSNFADTVAAIDNCDIIISSDNVIMNIAGALGKKTFCLFNKYTDYRWFDLTGEDVVFYTSVKPFQNTEMNDWEPTIDKVIEEIKKISNNINL